MTDPNDSNDDWAELAREFALDKPAPASEEPDEAESALVEDETPGLVSEAAETEAEDDSEDADDAATGESAADGDGALGTGRKRRRRRRRRRKGAPGEAAVPVGAREDEEDAEAPEDAAEREPVAEADDFDAPRDEGELEDDFDAEPAPLTAEEDTANEVLRELIATWNVPSWDSIVSGLYRPN